MPARKKTVAKLKSVKPSGKRDENFFELVFEVARQIPKGRVTSYGAIARSSDDSDSRVLVWIALKDHFVDTAVAYWVEGANLHYIKSDGSHNQISVGLVDRQTSARLNARGPGKLILP